MDKILESVNNYVNMLETKYIFTIVSNRRLRKVVLDFKIEDFRHIAGLHYIDDISIENNPGKLVSSIMEGKLTDAMLEKSSKYTAIRREGGCIKDRVEELCYLEDYLDNSDTIRIFSVQDFGSSIQAEYFIEATNMSRKATVYMFIRKRIESDNYVVVSFFKKNIVYKGSMAYWMLKEKIKGTEHITIYRNPNYKE